jgi:acetamidase/formamidase
MKHALVRWAAALVIALSLGTLIAAQARVHELKLLPQNVHWGYYDASVKPVLRVASGDTVRVETMIARGLPRLRAAGVKEDEIPESLKLIERTITERGPGAHPMTGPIFVEGAEPGDVLEVKIIGFEFLHPYGVSGFIPGGGTLPDEFPYVKFHLVRFDERAGTAAFAPGVTLKLAPFFGSIGVAPNRWSAASRAGRPDRMPAIWTTRSSSPDRRCTFLSRCRARCCRLATATRCKATAKPRSPRSRRRCAARCRSPSAKGCT